MLGLHDEGVPSVRRHSDVEVSARAEMKNLLNISPVVVEHHISLALEELHGFVFAKMLMGLDCCFVGVDDEKLVEPFVRVPVKANADSFPRGRIDFAFKPLDQSGVGEDKRISSEVGLFAHSS